MVKVCTYSFEIFLYLEILVDKFYLVSQYFIQRGGRKAVSFQYSRFLHYILYICPFESRYSTSVDDLLLLFKNVSSISIFWTFPQISFCHVPLSNCNLFGYIISFTKKKLVMFLFTIGEKKDWFQLLRYSKHERNKIKKKKKRLFFEHTNNNSKEETLSCIYVYLTVTRRRKKKRSPDKRWRRIFFFSTEVLVDPSSVLIIENVID